MNVYFFAGEKYDKRLFRAITMDSCWECMIIVYIFFAFTLYGLFHWIEVVLGKSNVIFLRFLIFILPANGLCHLFVVRRILSRACGMPQSKVINLLIFEWVIRLKYDVRLCHLNIWYTEDQFIGKILLKFGRTMARTWITSNLCISIELQFAANSTRHVHATNYDSHDRQIYDVKTFINKWKCTQNSVNWRK